MQPAGLGRMSMLGMIRGEGLRRRCSSGRKINLALCLCKLGYVNDEYGRRGVKACLVDRQLSFAHSFVLCRVRTGTGSIKDALGA